MKAVIVDSRIIDLFPNYDIEKRLFEEAGIDLVVADVKTPEEYIDVCKDADAVLLIGTKTDRQVLQQLKNCKVLVRYGVGYEVVDVPACTEAGIIFCNVPDAGTYEVGSHAFVLALDCLRKVSFYNTLLYIFFQCGSYCTNTC